MFVNTFPEYIYNQQRSLALPRSFLPAFSLLIYLIYLIKDNIFEFISFWVYNNTRTHRYSWIKLLVACTATILHKRVCCNTIFHPKLSVTSRRCILREGDTRVLCYRNPICGHSGFCKFGNLRRARFGFNTHSLLVPPSSPPSLCGTSHPRDLPRKVAACGIVFTRWPQRLVSSSLSWLAVHRGDNSIFSCKSRINTLRKQDRVHTWKERESRVMPTITTQRLARGPKKSLWRK